MSIEKAITISPTDWTNPYARALKSANERIHTSLGDIGVFKLFLSTHRFRALYKGMNGSAPAVSGTREDGSTFEIVTPMPEYELTPEFPEFAEHPVYLLFQRLPIIDEAQHFMNVKREILTDNGERWLAMREGSTNRPIAIDPDQLRNYGLISDLIAYVRRSKAIQDKTVQWQKENATTKREQDVDKRIKEIAKDAVPAFGGRTNVLVPSSFES